MHVAVDLNWFLQFVLLALAAALGFLYLLRNTASRYFVVDSNFASTAADFSSDCNIGVATMATPPGGGEKVSDACAVCGLRTTKHCSGCKMVKYCSEDCQRSHWNSEHKTKCKLQFNKANHTQSNSVLKERKASLVPARGSLKFFKESNKILYPYEEFVKFFDWEKTDYPPPCGLLNCGNSCFANVILQCLSYTRPLVAYLMEKGHKMECRMDNWCFLCEFQEHVETASRSRGPFSPINILSRLRSIGGNLDYGQQQDAHEFMRLAIDTMQSVCLDEFGGERAVHPNYQQTTLIQHIFGGRLQSQVICTECNNVSNQFENMMDLTVEIHGDAETLEECLDQYTAKEELHGDNKYKCDGCNAYVTAWKRLSIQQAPNILTIALKRFQSGRFGKLNKRVTFPETLNLYSYMGELEDGNDYMLYAVIVHLDMLNASYFGHYICYVKDFGGNWYKIDDNEVTCVRLDEVLSQGAYMLLYKRIHARLSCLLPIESCKKQENENVTTQGVDPSMEQPIECLSAAGLDNLVDSGNSLSSDCSRASVDIDVSTIIEDAKQEVKLVTAEASLPVMNGEIVNFEVAPKQSGVVNDTVEPVPVSTSLIDNSAMELYADEVVSSVSDVENSNVVNGINAEQGLERILTDEPPAAEDHKKGKESNISPVTTAEVQETNSVNGTSISDNVECRNGAILLDNDNNKAAKNSNGESSRAKSKPIFFPGFLDRPLHKDPVQKSKMTKEVEKMPKIPLNEQINEAMKVEENPCSVLQNGSVSTNSASNKSLKKVDSEPSSCIHCKYHSSNSKTNATGSRAAKPCC